MAMKSKMFLLFAIASLGIMAFIALYSIFVGGRSLAGWQCRNELFTVRWDIHDYCRGHTNHFPPDIFSAVAYNWQDVHSKTSNQVLFILTCPGTSTRTAANISPEPDYTYINWEEILGTTNVPSFYPLAYDKRLSNHLNLGVNVAPISGKVFWDFKAHWLKAFAAKYPEYHLPLPQ
jgi:hypothetical protein